MKKSLSTQLWKAQVLTTTINTKAVDVKRLDNLSFNMNVKSVTDNTGQFTVEVTNDEAYNMDGSDNSTAVWRDLGLTPTMVLANAAAHFETNLNQVPYSYARVKFVPAGGTKDGTVDLTFQGKGI